jgi:hypothetical protein
MLNIRNCIDKMDKYPVAFPLYPLCIGAQVVQGANDTRAEERNSDTS